MAASALLNYNKAAIDKEISAVKTAIDSLLSKPYKVDFYSVAKLSGVCRSTLYRNPSLRKMVVSARETQSDPWELVRMLSQENAALRSKLQDLQNPLAVSETVDYYMIEFVLAA